MGKFVVTGLKGSGKSAFIRSFASDEDASILKVISQMQPSTRFITKYEFGEDTDFLITITFKSIEDVAKDILDNIRHKIREKKESGKSKDWENNPNLLDLEKCIPFSFDDKDNPDPEISIIADKVFGRGNNTADIGFLEIERLKKWIGSIYEKFLQRIKGLKYRTLMLNKDSPLIWDT
ncbi:MAG: hypothetical protein K6E98_06975, partial [Lachnospiraceae bacterium]|nr:hypothetical protein [Lachnospiraceae bacterium]